MIGSGGLDEGIALRIGKEAAGDADRAAGIEDVDHGPS